WREVAAGLGNGVEDALGVDAPVLVDDRAHLGVAADAAAQQRCVPARVLLDVGEVGVDALVEALERVERGIGLGALAQLAPGLADDGHVEVALGREVVVEQALRDAGLRRDVVDGDLVVGALAEQLETDLDELAPARVEIQARAGGRGHGEPQGTAELTSIQLYTRLDGGTDRRAARRWALQGRGGIP